jgi:hypothetical protein
VKAEEGRANAELKVPEHNAVGCSRFYATRATGLVAYAFFVPPVVTTRASRGSITPAVNRSILGRADEKPQSVYKARSECGHKALEAVKKRVHGWGVLDAGSQ